MSTETPKQKMRRLLSRLKSLTPEQLREADRLIEEMHDDDAETFVQGLDEMENENPGSLEELIKDINANGIPDD